jgi:putative nucleotidyltransferase with HDIG domain
VSVGVASLPAHADSAADLVRAADSAMYHAKALGRNRSVVFSRARAATRIEQAKSAQRADAAFLGSVLALAAAFDARDSSTHQHSRMVARHAVGIAGTLGLDGDRLEEIRVAGLLHDIGKIGVPDAVLQKPGPLSSEEWAEMRRHPEIGARILTHPALADTREWVLCHHERPDGRGYPRGLTGDAIPLEAKILAVADAYEAMTADRPYRRALGSDIARAELIAGRGSQFDPEVVDAFLIWLGRPGPHERPPHAEEPGRAVDVRARHAGSPGSARPPAST